MKLEVFILGGQRIDQKEKEGIVERLRERKGEERGLGKGLERG